MRFKLEIALGNDAMQSGDDVAAAIRKVADTVAHYHASDLGADRKRGAADPNGKIIDGNGNAVGYWRVGR